MFLGDWGREYFKTRQWEASYKYYKKHNHYKNDSFSNLQHLYKWVCKVSKQQKFRYWRIRRFKDSRLNKLLWCIEYWLIEAQIFAGAKAITYMEVRHIILAKIWLWCFGIHFPKISGGNIWKWKHLNPKHEKVNKNSKLKWSDLATESESTHTEKQMFWENPIR